MCVDPCCTRDDVDAFVCGSSLGVAISRAALRSDPASEAPSEALRCNCSSGVVVYQAGVPRCRNLLGALWHSVGFAAALTSSVSRPLINRGSAVGFVHKPAASAARCSFSFRVSFPLSLPPRFVFIFRHIGALCTRRASASHRECNQLNKCPTVELAVLATD